MQIFYKKICKYMLRENIKTSLLSLPSNESETHLWNILFNITSLTLKSSQILFGRVSLTIDPLCGGNLRPLVMTRPLSLWVKRYISIIFHNKCVCFIRSKHTYRVVANKVKCVTYGKVFTYSGTQLNIPPQLGWNS